ncbi:MAG: hypothetical protein PUB86_06450 [Elusimicrobia bacterium]|nr:hypothetical protein [Elusimicrobiota bacterium]
MLELAALEQTENMSIIALVRKEILDTKRSIPERRPNAKDSLKEIKFTRDKTRLSTNHPA